MEEIDRVYRLPPNSVRDLFVQNDHIDEATRQTHLTKSHSLSERKLGMYALDFCNCNLKYRLTKKKQMK